ncbi:MAG: hypothetical protein R3C02_19075 [Planctomycetaceae bacterium]
MSHSTSSSPRIAGRASSGTRTRWLVSVRVTPHITDESDHPAMASRCVDGATLLQGDAGDFFEAAAALDAADAEESGGGRPCR